MIFQANIGETPGDSRPDEYNPADGILPPQEFVVTRNKDGSVLSRYGELRWDRSPYQTRSIPCNLYFDYWTKGKRLNTSIHKKYEKLGWAVRRDDVTPARVEIVGELQWLMFILIYLKPGKPLSNESLKGYCGFFHALGRLAEQEDKKIAELLSSSDLLSEKLAPHHNVSLVPLLGLLSHLGAAIVGFKVENQKDKIAEMAKLAKTWKDSHNQTPPIPTRIYSLILAALSMELDEFESVTDRVLALYTACAKDPLLGKTGAAQLKMRIKLDLGEQPIRPVFSDLLRSYELEEFWEKRGYPKTFQSLTTVIIDVFKVTAHQIQAFTGMRRNELAELPYDCLAEVRRNKDGKIHNIVRGRVTKLTGGKIKPVQWVTSESGRRAVLLAQRFSREIYAAAKALHPNQIAHINSLPLFISPWTGLRKIAKIKAVTLDILDVRLESRLLPLIEEKDVLELEFIDHNRNWRAEEDFQIGRLWPLTSHQLRRSLALYAQASGLVSLPSLKRQLQHITREMTLYYCKGSQFAKDFIGDNNKDKHFGEEWQEAQPVSQYFSYAAHVLMADDAELFGTHGHFVNTRLRNKQGVVLFDRDATLKRFEKGEMAYRETLLGGCTRVGLCDKNPLNLFQIDCITSHCKNMVGSRKKLERAIKVQRNFVAKLEAQDATTPEFRHEKANLDVLLEVRNKHFEKEAA